MADYRVLAYETDVFFRLVVDEGIQPKDAAKAMGLTKRENDLIRQRTGIRDKDYSHLTSIKEKENFIARFR